MRPTPDPIYAQLRGARLERGWSLRKAEVETGIPNVVIGSWERGDRNPITPQLRRWVEGFDRRLVVLEPDQKVLSTNAAAEEYVSFVVVYGWNRDGLIECDTEEEAQVIHENMPGSHVAHRVNRRGALRYGGVV